MSDSARISSVDHLYVHVPFCAHRCGYCDFVTTTAQPELHDRYVAGLRSELAARLGADSTPAFRTIFIGGGTPTLLGAPARDELLSWLATLAAGDCELTIECNPETVTEELAASLVEHGVDRVSLGAQTFDPELLAVLERRATPDVIRAAVDTLRSAGVSNLSLDIIWGIPGQDAEGVTRDLDAVIALEPNHCSAYELELKPGTRLAHAWAGRMGEFESSFDELYDTVVDRFVAAGYDWYETANFARGGAVSQHNLAYWTQRDYLGIGVGAVGTVRGERRSNLPNIPRWLAAVERGEIPPARIEMIDREVARRERIMLALRLARPCELSSEDLDDLIDHDWLQRMVDGGLVRPLQHAAHGGATLTLERRGRMMLNSVIVHLLTDAPPVATPGRSQQP